MSKRLDGKIAIVTGAGRGIGAGIARAFAREGASVACVSRTQSNSDKIAAECTALGVKALAYAVDVAISADVEAAVEKIAADFGRIDILVNNAGITKDNLLIRMSDADWDSVISTNLKGVFNWTKPVGRIMLKQRAGRIINVSSVSGITGNAGQANYSASKGGVISFTKSIAREFGSRGITCNSIAPGFTNTDMTEVLSEEIKTAVLKGIPLGRFGEVEDIAEAAVYLAGESGRYITGQVLTVDGGMVM